MSVRFMIARRIAFGLGLAALAGGCSRSPYELAPVTGVVTIDGVPFTEGKVMFAPVAKGDDRRAGRSAFGKLDASGAFELSTYEPHDGAVVGDHWVTVIRLAPVDAEGAPREPSPATRGKSFDRLAAPTLVTVEPDRQNEIAIALTKQDVAKYGVIVD